MTEHKKNHTAATDWSLTVSRVCVAVLFLVCCGMLVCGQPLLHLLTTTKALRTDFAGAMVLLNLVSYLCGALALATLALLYRFLGRLAGEEVFCAANVKALGGISLCCAAAAVLALAAGAVLYLPFAFVGVAAGFMALIVRVIGNAFARAVAMQHELDLTV